MAELNERQRQLLDDLRAVHEHLRDGTREAYGRINPFTEDLIDWRERGRYWTGDDRDVTIYNSTTLAGDVQIGRGTWIGPFCSLDGTGGLEIGEGCDISAGVQLVTHDSVRRALSGGAAPIETAPIRIGDRCFVGSLAVVTRGVTHRALLRGRRRLGGDRRRAAADDRRRHPGPADRARGARRRRRAARLRLKRSAGVPNTRTCHPSARRRSLPISRSSSASRRSPSGFEADGNVEDAITAVELGAIVAGARHPGVHASHRLERLLERIAAEHLEPLTARPAREGVERVLHIVTETYPVGGHSRMIWRWIERDGERIHTVVTTRQRAARSDGVGQAAEASGGAFVELDHETPALERARAVRELVADADVVVMHAHPNDPVAVLALAAAGERPPVVFFNHCDHLFWLGAGIVDALYSLRPVGTKLGLRRGIAAARQLQGPAPVVGGQDGNGPAANPDAGLRARARANLLRQQGWPSNTILLLSVGASYKFTGEPGSTLLDLVGPVVDANPRVRVLAIGPTDDGAWREANERTRGRIFAMGPRTGLAPVFAAADIYLESRPGGGPGASSEAAAHGLPVLTHAHQRRGRRAAHDGGRLRRHARARPRGLPRDPPALDRLAGAARRDRRAGPRRARRHRRRLDRRGRAGVRPRGGRRPHIRRRAHARPRRARRLRRAGRPRQRDAPAARRVRRRAS